MPTKFFSIIVVSLNPGERLAKTLQSILEQTFTDYEVIIKDGGSTDGSLDFLEKEDVLLQHPNIRLVREKDKSIYDGMNQALKYTDGRYVQFLNCGDLFYEKTVLADVAAFIHENAVSESKQNPEVTDQKGSVMVNRSQDVPVIFYGNQYNLLQNSVVISAPQINDFTCFRNVPCHQVCFYDRRLFLQRAYKPEYKVRADYEHFLYSVYKENARTYAMPIIICSYEGGGYSETKENRKRSADQHREITDLYLGEKARKYRLIMALSGAGLRTKIAESPVLSKPYNALKSLIYHR